MHRKLTEKEIANRRGFKVCAKNNSGTFDSKFHLTMQNPVDQTITFDHIHRNFLNNYYLSQLREYFCETDGRHLFDKDVQQLCIINIRLKSYNYGFGNQMPDGTPYIADLIRKNPAIETIDLSNTQLENNEAKILLEALNTNTRLLKLKLDGNYIDESYLKDINNKLAENNFRKDNCEFIASKLTTYLNESITPSANSPVRLFTFRERENKMEVAAKKSLIGAHLDVMSEIKIKMQKR